MYDGDDETRLFIPAGSPWMAAARDGRVLRVPEEPFTLVPQRYTEAHVLSFAWPGVAHAALLFFRPDWSPWSWYVNLEDPLRRSAVGFDTMDHELDAIVDLDGSWRWKDEDELAEAIRRGVIQAGEEPRLRAEGQRGVRRILDREPPFDRDWWSWRPDPAWRPPALPEGWEHL